ncbi:hypothetical protein BH10PSE6_BH10PSE6_23330 [soil metagenome]
MRRLSIAALVLATSLGACAQGPTANWTPIARPAPDDATPAGIAYLCEGRREVAVVYAKNRASVTLDNKTWRTEYQATGDGFRYVDASVEWSGRDDLAVLRQNGNTKPLAFNCRPTRRTT